MPKIDAWRHPLTDQLYLSYNEYIHDLKEGCRKRLGGNLAVIGVTRTYPQLRNTDENIASLADILSIIVDNELDLMLAGMYGHQADNIHRSSKLIMGFQTISDICFKRDSNSKKWKAEQTFKVELSKYRPISDAYYIDNYIMQLRDGVNKIFSRISLSMYYDDEYLVLKTETAKLPIIDSLRVLSCEEEANA